MPYIPACVRACSTAQAIEVIPETDPANILEHALPNLSAAPMKEARGKLTQAIASDDIELKPDGLLFLPEIKYRYNCIPSGSLLVRPKHIVARAQLQQEGIERRHWAGRLESGADGVGDGDGERAVS